MVACNFTHRWTDNENFFACGAGEPAAQARKLFRGRAREKKSVGFVDEGGKVPGGAEVITYRRIRAQRTGGPSMDRDP